jgi:hypothetical protein
LGESLVDNISSSRLTGESKTKSTRRPSKRSTSQNRSILNSNGAKRAFESKITFNVSFFFDDVDICRLLLFGLKVCCGLKSFHSRSIQLDGVLGLKFSMALNILSR